MENSEENHIKIANYLDNAMSPAEEAAFMQELGNNAVLRQQFEDELMIHSLLQEEEKESASIKEESHPKKTSVIALLKRYRVIAVLLLAIISGTVIFTLFSRKNKPAETAKTPANKEAAPKTDSIPAAMPKTVIAAEAFNHFYKPYSGESDPVELSNYYKDYKEHRYEKVISAKETDFQVMGTGEKNELLKQYMYLYKGLCYLEKNEPARAIRMFDSVLKSPNKTDTPVYEAQWYSAMAWLKKDDIDKAAEAAKHITQTTSPYKSSALQLIQQLNR